MVSIRGVFFDFDGVLVTTVELHERAFLRALMEVAKVAIGQERHRQDYNGLSTRVKIARLVACGILPEGKAEGVWQAKQRLTKEMMPEVIKQDREKTEMLGRLWDDGYKLACVSNSIRETTHLGLKCAGIFGSFDLILSNEDVSVQKPDPAPYREAMTLLCVPPPAALIVEDAPQGIESARRSGGSVAVVQSYSEVTYENVRRWIREAETA